jgi:hypothetical protein
MDMVGMVVAGHDPKDLRPRLGERRRHMFEGDLTLFGCDGTRVTSTASPRS